MTLKELSVLHDLNKEVDMDRRRLLELQNIAGMEMETEKIRRIITRKQKRNLEERVRLENWIAGIEDSKTRQIFTLRFVHGYTWLRVAMAVGGGNTEDSVRKIAKRYIAKGG